ncbi:hypothetical protein [Metamycoplasma hominis]|uniref:hypothetical protein n=1 Tax=Metamycoplasma hominis TaxID=2098 RepID=UPI001314C27A|nr:hypothetical protein [Metamycoplasma hominis]
MQIKAIVKSLIQAYYRCNRKLRLILQENYKNTKDRRFHDLITYLRENYVNEARNIIEEY